MKVFIITRAPFPVGTSSTGRIMCYAKGIIANGVECEVITTSQKDYSDNQCDVPYHRIVTPTKSRFQKFAKIIRGIVSLLRVYSFLNDRVTSKDIVLIYGDNLIDNINLLLIKKKKKFKIVYEFCEIPFMNSKFINRVKRWVQLNFIFKSFDGVLPISEELLKFALNYKNRNANVLKVPVLFDSDLQSVEKNEKISKHKYILHAGGLTEYKDGILTSIEAFGYSIPSLSNDVKFVIAGINRWKYSEKLNEVIAKYNLSNRLILLDLLTRNELVKWYNKSELCIIYKNDNIQNRNGFATKIADALSCQTAIITTTVGEPKNYLVNGKSAYIIDPDGPEVLSRKIIEAMNNDIKRKQIARAGKLVADKHFNNIKQGKRLITFFRELVIDRRN